MFEVFTNWKDESDALEAVNFSTVSDEQRQKNEIKNAVKKVVGKKGIEVIKKIGSEQQSNEKVVYLSNSSKEPLNILSRAFLIII